MSLRVGLLALVVLCAGCRGEPSLMPMAVGQRWNFRFRSGAAGRWASLEAVREVPMATGRGFELRGPQGLARLGLSGDRVVADQMASAFVRPPLPIGLPAGRSAIWSGRLVGRDGEREATATIDAFEAKVAVAGRERKAVLTVVKMKASGHQVVLRTWFVRGEGIVQQEQRTDGRLDVSATRATLSTGG